MSNTIHVSLTPTTVQIVRDGDPVEVVITIQNAGTTVDQYAVELDGLPTTWYSLSNSSVALFPQDKDEAKLLLRPPKGGTARAGTYPFTVIVLSRADPSQTTRAEGSLQIAAVAAFELDMSPRKVIGRRGRYRLTMRNGGNADLDVALEASDAEDGCRYVFQPPSPHLGPGQQATVALQVAPKRAYVAGPRKPFDFQIKATPGAGEARTMQGQLVYTPRLASWKPVRRLVLLALVVALVLAAVASQGGVKGVQARYPRWKASASRLLCERLNVLCSATITPSGPGSAHGAGGGGQPLVHATSTPRPTHTPVSATDTPAATPTPVPTATDTPAATDTPVPPATATPHPPTPTPQPATPTLTAQPATSTPHPPTSTPHPPTSTPRPPTATPHPPTATPRPPTATPLPPAPVRFAAPAPGAHYFSNTHHNLSGPFLSFWQLYGGLDVFGYPRTEPFPDKGIVKQYTDRFLLQLVDGQLRTAPLGRVLTAGRSFPPVAPFTSTPDRLYFASTHHSLTGRFLTFWRKHHGDIVLGAPIAEPTHEQNNDGSGRVYLVQWFESGRLEYHPEFAGTRYEVELGLAGKQDLQRRGWLPHPRSAPAPSS